jgi:hypothetical protein
LQVKLQFHVFKILFGVIIIIVIIIIII